VQPYVTNNGNLAFEQVPDSTAVMRAVGSVHGSAARRAGALRHRSAKLGHTSPMKRRAYRLLSRLPRVPRLAVFQSQLGQHYTGSPKYVYEAVRDRGAVDAVWVYAGSTQGFPKDARLVRRGSWRYYWALARAQYWVDDQGFPRQFTKPPGTTYVQTWHGTPLKRMGFDSPALESAGAGERAAHQAMIDRWDCLVAPSEYFVETFARSYRYHGPLLRSGSPRNDPLVNDDRDIEKLRESLQIPAGRKVVLYAPTFRDRDLRLKKSFQLQLDLETLLRELGDDYFFLIRPHYLDKLTLPRQHAGFVGDASRYPDVTELLLVSDILVTDYSSVMFDFANLGRPMIFFTYDYEDYVRDERGTYVDLDQIAPGPMVTDTDGLVAALRNVGPDEAVYRERYAAFRERFCAYESGRAAERVADELLSGRST
jgi:CDP-glycerol glycerophosphotransferase